jgi:pimeloyl-ACP methyl ester carboxylesterase
MLLQSYVRWREERLARIDEPHKQVEHLAYGLDLLGAAPVGDSLSALRQYVRHHLAHSDAFFLPAREADFMFSRGRLTFTSPLETEDPVNQRVSCRVFEKPGQKRAVVLLPHWNATAAGYDRLARCLQLSGVTAVRLSLPYHDSRRPPAMRIASGMVSANLGLTIRSCRQAVLDARRVIDWLEDRGYTRIGVIGSSLGSSIASLVAAHDARVRAAALLLTAGQFGEVVWTGRATRHIRQAFDGRITLEQLNEVWSIISPITYVPGLRAHDIAMLVLSGREDTVFQPYLTERLIEAYHEHRVRHRWRTLPCGHYTLATFPFAGVALAWLVLHLREHL